MALTVRGTGPEELALLFLGGSANLSPGDDTDAIRHAEKFVFQVNDPGASRWEPVADLPQHRFMSDGVLLPDGTVFLINGAGRGMSDHSALPRLKAFIFDPKREEWAEVAPTPRDRAYHATALLLPDGSVLVGGSTGHRFFPGHRIEEFQLDVFKPPYFFKGTRPELLEAPDAVGYGEGFSIRSTAASGIETVCLVRPGSTTHTNNMDRRRIELALDQVVGDRIEVLSPDDGTIAPPGFYLLFVINRDGIPPVGRFIHLQE